MRFFRGDDADGWAAAEGEAGVSYGLRIAVAEVQAYDGAAADASGQRGTLEIVGDGGRQVIVGLHSKTNSVCKSDQAAGQAVFEVYLKRLHC